MKNVPDFCQSFLDSNQTGVEFLITDLDVAQTFMAVAKTSGNHETIDRNHKNARDAYDTVLHLLQNLKPNAEQRRTIDWKMALLKKRLQAVGQQF